MEGEGSFHDKTMGVVNSEGDTANAGCDGVSTEDTTYAKGSTAGAEGDGVNAEDDTMAACSPKIAFATSGYHVFRSGYIASVQGIPVEGIGSRTRLYFWINAFIRELLATLYYEKKKHFAVFAVLFVIVTVMGSILFLSRIF